MFIIKINGEYLKVEKGRKGEIIRVKRVKNEYDATTFERRALACNVMEKLSIPYGRVVRL